jgi:phage tail-like protein
MSGILHPAYRFATEAQWQACHFAGADRRTAEARTGLRPFAPFAIPATSIWSGAAHAPAVTDGSELIWRDDEGGLFRLPYAELAATRAAVDAGLASATRIVATPGALWAVGVGGSLRAFDSDSLARLFEADLGGVEAIDIASDSGDGVYMLGRSDGRIHVVHFGCAGARDQVATLSEPRDASELVFLGGPKILVVLNAARSKLYFIDPLSGRLATTVLVSALRGCFKVDALGSDGCTRFFIAGTDEKAARDGNKVLVVDEDGVLLGTLPVEDEVTGIAATRGRLILSTRTGVSQFDPATTVPQGAGEVKAIALTPLLQSPAKGPQQWIRVEAKVRLPAGSSVQVTHATVSDPAALANAERVLSDETLPQAQRLAEWRGQVERRTFTYSGEFENAGEAVIATPLHDVSDQSIWIELTLIAAPGGQLPIVSEMKVLYPGPTLIEHLPAIYRSGELKSGDFTRALVGVLETGVQNLDEEIGRLGRKIHPDTADSAWLDYIASWLGLPWDNALDIGQKRNIVSRGQTIAAGYSTRAGLEELLDCLVPGPPRRFRVVDLSADHGLATIAGRDGEGSRLPAILAGLPAIATELGNKAILGRARLPCPDMAPPSVRLVGNIRVDIAATAREREAWSPWIERLVEQMLPVSARAVLRWLGPRELTGGYIHDNSELSEEPGAHLGSDAITGASRLSGATRTMLPTSLNSNSTLQ